MSQSGSAAPSGPPLEPATLTRLVAFDTAVVDLTDELDGPVEVLFGTPRRSDGSAPRRTAGLRRPLDDGGARAAARHSSWVTGRMNACATHRRSPP